MNPKQKLMLAVLAMSLTTYAHAKSPLLQLASINDLDLRWQYLGTNIDSACGTEWFMLAGDLWKCVKPSTNGRLEVLNFGRLQGSVFGGIVIRPPIRGDRRLLIAGDFNFTTGSAIYGLDPVTLEVAYLGQMPGRPSGQDSIDFDGDGTVEYLLRPSLIVSFPDGAGFPSRVLQTLPFEVSFAGQFDADPNTELGVVDRSDSTLRFYDAHTLALEPYAPVGGFFADGILVADWDHDGVDEVAIPAFGPTTALVDPNGSSVPIFVNSSGERAFSLVDWQGPDSRELVLRRGSTLMLIFDPRTGALISQAVNASGGTPERPIRADWDNDGDEDLAWVNAGGNGNALILMRNSAGTAVLQRESRGKLVAGHSLAGDLISIEVFGGINSPDYRMRSRDPRTLALLSDISIQPGSNSFFGHDESYVVADLASDIGTELLQVTRWTTRLYSSDGSLIWSLPLVGAPSRNFSRAAVPDRTCVGAEACQRVFIWEDSFLDDDVLRLLDSSTGREIWSQSSPNVLNVAGMTDLNADGIPELMYSDSQFGIGSRLVVLDGVTRAQIWVKPGGTVRVGRTDGTQSRLAVLGADAVLSYLNPANGDTLRSIAVGPNSCSTDCELSFVRQGDRAGSWLVTGVHESTTTPTRNVTVDRDLRTPIYTHVEHRFDQGLAHPSKNIINVRDRHSIYSFELENEAIFADEFE